jgi:hypothetical protein
MKKNLTPVILLLWGSLITGKDSKAQEGGYTLAGCIHDVSVTFGTLL